MQPRAYLTWFALGAKPRDLRRRRQLLHHAQTPVDQPGRRRHDSAPRRPAQAPASSQARNCWLDGRVYQPRGGRGGGNLWTLRRTGPRENQGTQERKIMFNNNPERAARDEEMWQWHKQALAAGQRRVLSRTMSGELYSYAKDEIGFRRNGPGNGVSTLRGLIVVTVVMAASASSRPLWPSVHGYWTENRRGVSSSSHSLRQQWSGGGVPLRHLRDQSEEDQGNSAESPLRAERLFEQTPERQPQFRE